MATVKLKVRPRTELGKRGAKHARAAGDVPAVLYGEGESSVPLAIDAHDFRIALSTPAGRNVIIQLRLNGEDATTRAIIREMDRDPVSREILHIDLQRISENKPVVIHVPVTLTGESPAVKEGRGILDHTMRQVEVKCLPGNIPEHIEVDISTLEVKHAIHVSDLSVQDVELLDNPERPVVEVLQPTIYQEPVAEAVEGAEEGEVAPEGGEETEEGAAEATPEGGGETQRKK